MNDCEILSLAFCSEAISISSEKYFWGKVLSNTSDFQNLIDRSNYNRRRRNLVAYFNILTTVAYDDLNKDDNIFIVDSMPLPVCNIVRVGCNQVLRENYDASPDKGYSAITKTYI